MKHLREYGRTTVFSALMLLTAAVASGAAAAEAPKVENAWIKLPVVAGRPAVLYATLVSSGRADQLVAVEGPKPATFELHTSLVENGVVRMVPLNAVDIAAGGRVEMKPGGTHVMVFGLPATEPGATVRLTFEFRNAGRVPATARAMAAGDAGHAHH